MVEGFICAQRSFRHGETMKHLLFLSLLLSAALARADFNPKDWHSRWPLAVSPGMSVSEFIVGPDIFRHSSARLSDLRIIRGDASEVPYTIRLLAGEVQQAERSALVRDKSWTKGKGVQAIFDLKDQAEHNRLRIVTPERNFKQAVIVETSSDAKHWSTVLSDGVIFDISRPEVNVSDLTVTYPTSTRRFVRVTIPGWSDPAALESAWLAERKETDATRDNIAQLQPVITQHKDEQTTDLLFDLGFAGQPCDRLALQVAPGFFSRSVEISTGNDPKMLSSFAGATIDRTSAGDHLTVEWGETWDRYIKLTVFNADSAPLDFGVATASAIRRVVRFPSNAAGTYWLYVDNAAARTPSYDFARVEEPKVAAAVARVGAMEPNPAFEAPAAPYSERNPWLLNVILGIAVAVMTLITYRFARKATSPKV